MSEIKISPFRFWCQKVIPLVYDESLSYYELLCKVVDYINNMATDVNTLADDVESMLQQFTDLQDYVDNYLDNLNVEEYLEEALDELAANGTLSSMLSSFYNSRECHLSMIGRLINDVTGETGTEFVYQSCTYDNGYYVAGNTGELYTIAKYSSSGALEYYNNEAAYIGHANDITTDALYLYAATGNSPDIARYNKTTLEYVDNIDLSDYLINVQGVCYYENELWFYGNADIAGNIGIGFVNENGEVEHFFTTEPFYAGVQQGMCVDAHNIYILYNQEISIARINKETHSLDFIYYIPESNGVYPTGECESLFWKDNEICLAGVLYYTQRSGTGSAISAEQKAFALFKLDIISPTVENNAYSYHSGSIPLVVNVNGNMEYAFNPMTTMTATSITVSTLVEGCLIANMQKACEIRLSNLTDNVAVLKDGSYTIVAYDPATVSLTSLECYNSDIIFAGLDAEHVYLRGCKAEINFYSGCLPEGFTINFSDAKLYNLTGSSITDFTINESKIAIYDMLTGFNSNIVFTVDRKTGVLFEIHSSVKRNNYYEKIIGSLGTSVYKTIRLVCSSGGDCFDLYQNATGYSDFTVTAISALFGRFLYNSTTGNYDVVLKNQSTQQDITGLVSAYIDLVIGTR